MKLIDNNSTPVRRRMHGLAALKAYSLRGSANALQRTTSKDKPFLSIARTGQATVIFGAPNTGKTLLILRLLGDAIRRRIVDPDKITYVNADDTASGLLEKLRFAEDHGFHVISPGHRGFSVRTFEGLLQKMSLDGSASGEVVILDTLKRFVDPMDKSLCRAFTETVRQFVGAGGTLIALAHTNKHRSLSGKPVPGGTSDILDDFDCAYTLAKATRRGEPGRQYVEFENIKSRGDVATRPTYSYEIRPGASYAGLLDSVREEGSGAETYVVQAPDQAKGTVKNSSSLEEIIERCIGKGGVRQTVLVQDAVFLSGRTQREVLAVLRAKSGDDPQLNRWGYRPGPRGAKLFYVHQKPDTRHVAGLKYGKRF